MALHSLRTTVLLPMLVVGLCAALAVIVVVGMRAYSNVHDNLQQRAEVIAHAANYVAESISKTSEMQRVIAAMGAEQDVTFIAVIGGAPLRIIASTRRAWVGRLLADIPDLQQREDIALALNTRVEQVYDFTDSSELSVTTPLLLSDSDKGQVALLDGVAVVHLDARSTYRAAWTAALLSSIGFVLIFGLVGTLGYVLFRRRVLTPLSMIGRHLSDRQIGTVFPASILAGADEIGIVAMTLDQALTRSEVELTERKQAQEELRQSTNQLRDSEERIKTLIDNIPGGIYRCANDLGWTMEFISDYIKGITGYPASDFINSAVRSYASIIHPLDVKLVDSSIQEGIREKRPYDIEYRLLDSHDGIKWVHEKGRGIFDGDGKLLHLDGAFFDVTARKKLEEESKLAQAEILRSKIAMAVADQANEAKSSFLANMSHEIRTPMSSIIGMAHLALKTELSPKQHDYLAKIQYSSEHLLGIINDILDYSKIEAHKLVIEALDFDLPTMLKDLSSQLFDSAMTQGLEIVFDIDPRLSESLRGDPLRLRQILLNYIDNAIKFTPQGKIIVRANLLEETASDCLVRFEVQDTGIGMSEAEMAQLFQPFQQVDTSITRNYGGTGVGLAICKQLAELMGGEVGVESRLAQGSTFWFTARLSRGVGKTVPVQEVLPPVDLSLIQGAAVLLVEDNLFNQQVAREMLEQAGAVVTLANNGQEALACLLKDRFDCVLMDVQMPVMDGLEATRQIRANPAWSSTRVIGLTANAGKEDQAHCLEAGMNDFVSKPIEPDQLLAVLATWLTPQPGQSQPAHAASTAGGGTRPPPPAPATCSGE